MSESKRWVMMHRRALLAGAMAGSVVGPAFLHGLGDRLLRGGEVTPTAIPTKGLPRRGAPVDRTTVTMIVCSDFECPFSKRATNTIELLLERNDDLAFHFVHLPLGMFEHSELKARAAVAAQRQKGFWVMHDALYDAEVEEDEDAVRLAHRLGLDDDRFETDLLDRAVKAEVARQRRLCVDAGVRAVPTFFVNGQRVVGAVPPAQLQRVIDQQRR